MLHPILRVYPIWPSSEGAFDLGGRSTDLRLRWSWPDYPSLAWTNKMVQEFVGMPFPLPSYASDRSRPNRWREGDHLSWPKKRAEKFVIAASLLLPLSFWQCLPKNDRCLASDRTVSETSVFLRRRRRRRKKTRLKENSFALGRPYFSLLCRVKQQVQH